MNKFLLILGNQLFPTKHYTKTKIKNVFMAEDYGLCTHYKYHKHKIILFLSAMRSYKDELDKKNFNVSYYPAIHKLFKNSFEDKLTDYLSRHKNLDTLVCYEIEDHFFNQQITKFCKKNNLTLEILQTPLFMTSRKEFKDYLKRRKKPFMKTFYEDSRKSFKILVDDKLKPEQGKWSFDEDNRKKLPKDQTTPELPKSKLSSHTKDVMEFVNKEFKTHPGVSENFWIPTTRKESLTWLKSFIKDRLDNFGSYQDAITADSDFVFHSILSPMINMGLLLPEEVIHEVEKAYMDTEQNIPINSAEGFIRQVLGWREFVRGIYQNYAKKQWETNFWNHQRKLNECWYTGDTGIPVIDDCIKKAVKYSYNHHIERLMVMSNIMLLSEVHPREVYKWFMEMFSDSSDWVMGPNVFGMGQFSDGGIFATKPYICGSNYLLKMSRYKKGDWCHILDGLYWKFIDNHQEFYKTNHRASFMLKNLERIDKDRKKMIYSAATEFIERTTHL